MSKDHLKVYVLRAGSIGGSNPPEVVIEIIEQIGEVGSLREARQLHKKQGEVLAEALLASLPGGTVDALLAELMRRRASLFSVPLVDAITPP